MRSLRFLRSASLLCLSRFLLANAVPPVQLNGPASIRIGSSYEAELSIDTDHDIENAYVKFAVPEGLSVTAGETHYRGRIAAPGLKMRITFSVIAAPEAPLAARLSVYDSSG